MMCRNARTFNRDTEIKEEPRKLEELEEQRTYLRIPIELLKKTDEMKKKYTGP